MLLSAAATGMMMMGVQADVPAAVPALPPPALSEAASAPDAPAIAPSADQAGVAQQSAQPAQPVSPEPAAPPLGVPAAGLVAPPVGQVNGAEAQNEIVVTGDKKVPGDPLSQVNEQSFEAVQAVDKAVVEPVAHAYRDGVPHPARKGLRNFFRNLQEPVVAVAYLLQFKPGKAAETVGRFAINSTLGFVGLWDVAKRKPFYLPYRPNGVANTLAFYGVGPGPFFYLPVVGATTLRDLVGDTIDNIAFPMVVGPPLNRPAYVIPSTILDQLGERVDRDEKIQHLREQGNPYAAYREDYLYEREAEIHALHSKRWQEKHPLSPPPAFTQEEGAPGVPAVPQAAPSVPATAVPAAEPAAPAPQPVPPAVKPLMIQPLPADPR
ncbi:MlaA family lipoprotein [Sphingobium sp. AP49]|uniref:MlaA family lipoprotein n=1 Tax=Sphingobium sp. AP49 TaxID=1144307 RepID=UPI00026EDF7B|nr:VacJ family lipoprotein [Sphingobium sp. AP49]WHO38504.1 MlaA family lipoprotein [Sphingobium sp. AP49]